ncbi:MAG TPA: transglycosylase SLT domain-containing protein [Reyranella sp.]|nr:transglycosylase SLT domain-containing protein [Reyranella sp.]
MKRSSTALRRLAPACALAMALTVGFGEAASAAPVSHEAANASVGEPRNFFQRILSFFTGEKTQHVVVAVTKPVPVQPFTYLQLDPNDVEGAIRQAAVLTGVPETYLVRTAWKESTMNPLAEASTSSAAGLYQVVDGTWLELMKRYGEKYGLAAEAALIDYERDGDPYVTDWRQRERIMDLRFDARVSALLAAELAAENMRILSNGLGRQVGDTDLYIAHFIGPSNAVKLLASAERSPGRAAAPLFPSAARANEPIFYKGGRARSCAEVVRRLALT